MRILILMFILLAAVEGIARTTDFPAIKERIGLLCPEAVILDTEYREGFTEVEFMCGNTRMEALFDGSNNLMQTEKEVRLTDELHEKISKKLNKAYEGWDVDDVHFVKTADTSFYSVELLKGGIEETAYFTSGGSYYRPERASAGGRWSTGELAVYYEQVKAPYNFLHPSKVTDLPVELLEVSGIALAAKNQLYLVQDETGVLFVYDMDAEKVTRIIRFTDTGDFEDVAAGSNTAWVLRSDGVVFSVRTDKTAAASSKMEQVPVQSLDNEGLFFDSSHNRLYLAAKSKPEDGDSNHRLVYQMTPGRLSRAEVAFVIDTKAISDLLRKTGHGISDDDKDIKFNPSAIAVHPVTGETYVLSANDRLLAVYKNNRLRQVLPLPGAIFHKPEGLAFAKNGDLIIASEGIKNGYLKGRIIRLSYR